MNIVLKSNHSNFCVIWQLISCAQWGASHLGSKLLPICPTVYQQGRSTLCPKVNTNLYQFLVFALTSTELYRRLHPCQNAKELNAQLNYLFTQNQSNSLRISKSCLFGGFCRRLTDLIIYIYKNKDNIYISNIIYIIFLYI